MGRFLLLSSVLLLQTAWASELVTETNAKKTPDGKHLLCVSSMKNGEDGGFERLEVQCSNEEKPASFSLEQLQAGELGAVTQKDGDRDAVWARLEPGFERFKDLTLTMTFLKNGITGDKGSIQLHAYLVGGDWLVKLVDPEKGELEVTKLCGKRKQFWGKTVGIEKMTLPDAQGKCKF
jgi:hypothetical protein